MRALCIRGRGTHSLGAMSTSRPPDVLDDRLGAYRAPAAPLLARYPIRIRAWHWLGLVAGVASLVVLVLALVKGVILLPCILVGTPSLIYALAAMVREVQVYADRVVVRRVVRPSLVIRAQDLSVEPWAYGVRLRGGGRAVALTAESFESGEAFERFVVQLETLAASRRG